VRVELVASSAQSQPASAVRFGFRVVVSFNSQTRQLGYEVVLSGASRDQVAGVYLHRRTNRANGGVAAGPAQLCIDATGRSAGSGGGSGGAILLEAVVFSLDASATFPVNGGAGSTGTSGATPGAG